MVHSWNEDGRDDNFQNDTCNDDVQSKRNQTTATERTLLIKQDIIEVVADHLNQVTRTMSGYAGMLERHLSIQDDTVGSEYAVGVRGELEQLHTLLHHLRPIARKRGADLSECQLALDRLNKAISGTA